MRNTADTRSWTSSDYQTRRTYRMLLQSLCSYLEKKKDKNTVLSLIIQSTREPLTRTTKELAVEKFLSFVFKVNMSIYSRIKLIILFPLYAYELVLLGWGVAGGLLPYKGLMGTCGQPGYVFRDFCLKQGIEFIIFCLNQGIDLSIFVLNRISFLGR